MRYQSVSEVSKKWGVSERTVRNYCAKGRITGAFITGKTWNIPADATKPDRNGFLWETINYYLMRLVDMKRHYQRMSLTK